MLLRWAALSRTVECVPVYKSKYRKADQLFAEEGLYASCKGERGEDGFCLRHVEETPLMQAGLQLKYECFCRHDEHCRPTPG